MKGQSMLSLISAIRTSRRLGIIIVSALLLLLIFSVQYYYTRGLLEDELEQKAKSELLAKAVLMRHTLTTTELSMRDHVWDIVRNMSYPDSMFAATYRLISANNQLVGGYIAFIPYYYKEKGRLFEAYVYKKDGKYEFEQIGNEKHDYTQGVIFKEVFESNEPQWSSPYIYTDKNGKTSNLITYSYPFRSAEGKVVAVGGVDLSLVWLSDTINSKHLYPSSFNLVLTQKGELIVGPSKEFVRKRDAYDDDDVEILKIINDSTTQWEYSDDGCTKRYHYINRTDGENSTIFLTYLKDSPKWQIAVVCYDDEVYKELYHMRTVIALLMLVLIGVLTLMINLFARNERKLQKASIDRERIDGELRVAREIQMSMLPSSITQTNTYDILGLLEPAKEVGGDLFDYFERNEKLFFCIGDVSGKGMASALVMSVTHTLFRSAASRESDPAHIMQAINHTVCEGNERNMFVTLFIGVLDLPTGRLRYCNAGHDIPMLLTKSKATMLSMEPNLPIGAFSDTLYTMQQITIMPETTIFLYTDGLTEAMNKEHRLFGEQRLNATLGRCTAQQQLLPSQLLEQVSKAYYAFVNEAPQSDDLTMLAIRYTPVVDSNRVLSESIMLSNSVSEVKDLNKFVKDVLNRLNIETNLVRKLQLAVEEAVVNVISYAYPEGTTGNIQVSATADSETLRFIITDSGSPFDPTVAAKADTNLSIEERPIGGLGILLLRELMDTINYERVDGNNILTLSKKYKTQ